MENYNLLHVLKSDNSFAMRYFTFRFNKFPQIASLRCEVDADKLIKLIQDKFKDEIEDEYFEHVYKISDNKHQYFEVDIVFKKGLIIMFNSRGGLLKIKYLHETIWIRDQLIELVKQCQIKDKDQLAFYMISCTDNLYLNKMELEVDDKLNLEDLYNENLIDKIDKIDHFINEDTTGLMLLHGEPGTGKTTFIKHLIKRYPGKKFIYVPNNIFKQIDGPSFIQFFIDYKDSILILEDAEALLIDRDLGNTSISTLLNLTEGLLGEALKLKVICTFNCQYNKIDRALIRKGRLKFAYKFEFLTIDKVNNLFSKLDINYEATECMSLTNVINFNLNNDLNVNQNKKIGF